MLVKSRLKAKAVVFVALSLSACGQGANVTHPRDPNSANGTSKAQPQAVIPESKPESKVEAAPSPSPVAPVVALTPPAVTPTAPLTPQAAPSTQPVAPPATRPVAPPVASVPSNPVVPPITVVEIVPLAGPHHPGATGPAGPAGVAGCGLHDDSINARAKPMASDDYTVADLPYLTTRKHKIEIKSIGVPNHVTRPGGVPYIQDAQVLFKFPVHLPPKEAIHHISDAYIVLNLTKISNDHYPDTEWLCFLDQKICSGKKFDDKERSWKGNINDKFWDHLHGNPSEFFVTELRGDRAGQFEGKSLWKNEAFTLKIEDLIKDSTYPNVTSFLYDGVAENARQDRDIRVVVADDTYIKEAYLVVNYQENTCKTNELDAVSLKKGD